MHRQEIGKLAQENSKDKPGSRAYISCFSKARRLVEQQLTNSQRQKYMAMAKDWSEGTLPPAMQKRYLYSNNLAGLESTNSPPTSMMNKHGPSAVKEFTSSAYNQFGMRVVVLAAFVDAEGDPSITL